MTNVKRKVLITGGSGFIGTNLIDKFLKEGDRVLNIDIAEPRNRKQADLWRRVDIRDEYALKQEFEKFKPDHFFHLAARTDLDGKDIRDYSSNTEGVSKVVSVLNDYDRLESAVFASSMLVCSLGYEPVDDQDYCPSTIYGKSKMLGEIIVRENMSKNIPWVIVRPTSIWGPWFASPYRDFFSMVGRGLYFHPAGVKINRHYGFVMNSTFQLEQIARKASGIAAGKTLYLTDYDPINVKDLAVMISNELNSGRVRELPLSVFRVLAIVGDLMQKFGVGSPPLTSFRLQNLLTETSFDIIDLKEICGDLPYRFEDAVTITCNWIRSNP